MPGYDKNVLVQLKNLIPADPFTGRTRNVTLNTADSAVLVDTDSSTTNIDNADDSDDSDDSDVSDASKIEDVDDFLDAWDIMAVEEDRWESSEFLEEPVANSRKRTREN